MAESSPNMLKTMWEKEKLLVTSNYSFPYIVFKTCTANMQKPEMVYERVKGVLFATVTPSVFVGLFHSLILHRTLGKVSMKLMFFSSFSNPEEDAF